MSEKEVGDIFIQNLKELLQKKKMSYKEFADKIGVKASSVSMWMNGYSLPRMGTLDKIANLFGVSVDYLITPEHTLPVTLAAHFDGDEYTDDELEEIRKFAEFVKSKRKDQE